MSTAAAGFFWRLEWSGTDQSVTGVARALTPVLRAALLHLVVAKRAAWYFDTILYTSCIYHMFLDRTRFWGGPAFQTPSNQLAYVIMTCTHKYVCRHSSTPASRSPWMFLNLVRACCTSTRVLRFVFSRRKLSYASWPRLSDFLSGSVRVYNSSTAVILEYTCYTSYSSIWFIRSTSYIVLRIYIRSLYRSIVFIYIRSVYFWYVRLSRSIRLLSNRLVFRLLLYITRVHLYIQQDKNDL